MSLPGAYGLFPSEEGEPYACQEHSTFGAIAGAVSPVAAEAIVIDARIELEVGVDAGAEQVMVVVEEVGDADFSDIDTIAPRLDGTAGRLGMLIVAAEDPGSCHIIEAGDDAERGGMQVGRQISAFGRETIIGDAAAEDPCAVQGGGHARAGRSGEPVAREGRR